MKNAFKWKRFVSAAVAAAVITTAAAGCSSSTASSVASSGAGKAATGESVTISVWTQRNSTDAPIFQEEVKQFETENPNIKVEFNAPGNDYENMLKIKMASNEMPDIWSTHGWAIGRYQEFLADLSNEPWVSRMIPSIKEQVTDKNGRVLSMCVDSDTSAIGYNVGIFEKYGCQIPKTIDELLAVCEKIKTESKGTVTPIHIGGGDGWPLGQAIDYLSSTLLTTDKDHNFGDSLKNGSFDWNNYKPIGNFFQTLKQKGYLNVDVLTAKNDDTTKAFADNKAAIALNGFGIADAVKKLNPDVKVGFFPVPSFYKTDAPVIVGGETDAWGIWKDTKHLDAAKKFIEFFARPDVNKKVCEATSIRSAFTDVTADLGAMSPYYAAAKDVKIVPYFDRAFLPNGMWDSIPKYGQMLFTNGYSVDTYVNDMKTDYLRLLKK